MIAGPWRRAAGVLGGALAGLVLATPWAVAGENLPSWARRAMQSPTPLSASSSPAVVLLKEGSIEMKGGGRFVERERGVIRILSSAGADEAEAGVWYRTDDGSVRVLHAWVVGPSGKVREISSKEAVDRVGEDYHVYDETRYRSLSGASDAVPGATFVYEWSVEGRLVNAQFGWRFQGRLPTLRSEISFLPAPGWGVRGIPVNADSVAVSEREGATIWAMGGLPPIRPAHYAPPLSSVAPWLAISATPSASPSSDDPKSFASWREVSSWLGQVCAPRAIVTAAIEREAKTLVASASSRTDSIQAVAAFCRALNYVSVQMGTSRGGGYVPHSADQVYAKRYGDCKDKANLMRTLLRAIGIDAYLCLVSAFDPGYVRESWPTPSQFDHCIVAIRTDDGAACAVESGALGRLVLFDPTSSLTSWGSLPEDEQGGWALVVAERGGDLVRVPAAGASWNLLERRLDVRVSPNGSALGRATLTTRGPWTAAWRQEVRSRGENALKSSTALWLGAGIPSAEIDSFSWRGERADGSAELEGAFRISRFGRPTGGALLLIDPGRFSTAEIPPPPDADRNTPMLIDPIHEHDDISLAIPDGYTLEVTASPIRIESRYGTYTAESRFDGGVVAIDRTIRFPRSIVPATEWAEASEFLWKVRRALDTPLVLVKK